MGVPKFFRYMSERYPCLSELVRENKIPEFDNLYLDMNGIIHNCSHPDDSNVHFRITEEEIFRDIFNYIDKLFTLIKPQKLFFMAVDGVAPRAKMNQQRSRRFRSAKEAEVLSKQSERRGEKQPEEARFDSNCITPGTEFMDRLQNALKYFVKMKISSNKLWQNCTIILSGHETPGEGEHKIMEYIRYLKSAPDYNSTLRHCLYGLDADLIILGLCTHEPYFSLLREEVKFGKKSKRSSLEETRFYLLHLGLFKEYLELEFELLKENEKVNFDMDCIIDDWILMGFLVGNDFIPHLPNFHINTNALPILYETYRKVLPQLNGYINENGILNLERFEVFMKELAIQDRELFKETHADLKYLESKTMEAFNINIEDIRDADPEDDLAAFIQSSQDFFDCDEDFDSDDDQMEEKEFTAHKRNYYINKLGYKEVTPNVLAEQTQCYVRALQWILHYYYQGVVSWCWFYPHHYAPYTSDIKNFKNMKLDFERGKPFLPFQQLLAVLPAASKDFLPQAYQELMTDPNSEIIEYYPQGFETDLNGKKQDWEAVVLIPFLDEKRLLSAMEPCNKNLTDDENRRNTHRPMLEYKYSAKSTGECPGFYSFRPLVNVFCSEREITREFIMEKTIKGALKRKCGKPKYMPGFPTMKHLTYTGTIKKIRVRVFDQPSRNESMTLLPYNIDESADLEAMAKKFLKKLIYIGWPHIILAKVIALSNETARINASGKHTNDSKMFETHLRSISEHHILRMGIEYGDIYTIVHATPLIGNNMVINQIGRVEMEPVWSKIEIAFPVQGIVSNIDTNEHKFGVAQKIEDIFSVGSNVFMLDSAYYGNMAKVIDPKLAYACGRIKVELTVVPEPDLFEAQHLNSNIDNSYVTAREASQMIGLPTTCFSRITGAVFVVPGVERDIAPDTHKVNVGLHMKFPKNKEELLGYSRKVGNSWMYSQAAIDVVRKYWSRFPQLFELMSENNSNDVYFESQLFPNEIGEHRIKEITTWLKEQDIAKADKVPCGTKFVEKEAIPFILDAISSVRSLPVKNLKAQVKPRLILLPGGNVSHVYAKFGSLNLFDRVVNIRENYQVPLGWKGTVVATHPVRDPNPVRLECVRSVDMFYEVLFDKEFPEGYSIHGLADQRIFKVSESSLLPIFGEPVQRKQEHLTFKVNDSSQQQKKKSYERFADIVKKSSPADDNVFRAVKVLSRPNNPPQVQTHKQPVEDGSDALRKLLGVLTVDKKVEEKTEAVRKNETKAKPKPDLKANTQIHADIVQQKLLSAIEKQLPKPPEKWRTDACNRNKVLNQPKPQINQYQASYNPFASPSAIPAQIVPQISYQPFFYQNYPNYAQQMATQQQQHSQHSNYPQDANHYGGGNSKNPFNNYPQNGNAVGFVHPQQGISNLDRGKNHSNMHQQNSHHNNYGNQTSKLGGCDISTGSGAFIPIQVLRSVSRSTSISEQIPSHQSQKGNANHDGHNRQNRSSNQSNSQKHSDSTMEANRKQSRPRPRSSKVAARFNNQANI